ncbi:UNVERIFIED_CONTAM: hypothetical protein FKN15_073085 [Acipenser sinensis]
MRWKKDWEARDREEEEYIRARYPRSCRSPLLCPLCNQQHQLATCPFQYYEKPEHPRPQREESVRPRPEREESVRPRPEREESVRPRPEREESVHPRPEREESVHPRPEREESVPPPPAGEDYLLSLPPSPPPAEGACLLVHLLLPSRELEGGGASIYAAEGSTAQTSPAAMTEGASTATASLSGQHQPHHHCRRSRQPFRHLHCQEQSSRSCLCLHHR